jgi:hypothetical protein
MTESIIAAPLTRQGLVPDQFVDSDETDRHLRMFRHRKACVSGGYVEYATVFKLLVVSTVGAVRLESMRFTRKCMVVAK